MRLLKLNLQSFVKLLILNSSLIKSLLKTCLANCFISNIIELSKQSVVEIFTLVLFHEIEDTNDLSLEVQIFFHQLLTGFFIFNFMDKFCLIILLIKLPYQLINWLSSLKILSLQLLNVEK